MAQIKTVTTTSGTNSITFDAHYPYVWFKNLGAGDVYVSDNSQAQAGADDTALLKAGEIIRITAQTDTVYVVGATTVEVHAQGFADCPFKVRVKGGGITVEPLSVTDNGTYTAPSGKAYSPVTVDVQEQPWQPLEDGYSNFWFELTDDTLSPWLNFSAKNADAVIDWGDGTGEVALDTLTPTHTYSKAGKYVVKVKGVTGIAAMEGSTAMLPLVYVELNDEVTTLSSAAFRRMMYLRRCVFNAVTSISANATFMNSGIESLTLPNSVTDTPQSFAYGCTALQKVTFGNNVTEIKVYGFYSCQRLSEIHIATTTPPTLGGDVFTGLPSDFIIYVPVGTGDTYKAAEGWSTYADHIVEEGQSLSKAALRRIQLAETDESEVR
jgi:hypothetical protein